jgi:RNA polymerase sigma-32 factor
MSSNIQPVDLMSPGGNLEAYIQAVNTIPLLSVEEEKELAEKLYYDADLICALSCMSRNPIQATDYQRLT